MPSSNSNPVAQHELLFIQKYGDYGHIGLTALNHFREILLQLSTEIDESFDSDLFRYRLGSRFLCYVNWHRYGLQIIVDPVQAPAIFDIEDSSLPDWNQIRFELARQIESASETTPNKLP
jgi:hypothetical protein